MGNLLLNSLGIRNFRGFRHLQIERLGRVNLIVGKNNIGKSSLLEALQLYAQRGFPMLIWEMLDARDESLYPPPGGSTGVDGRITPLKYLFYGRRDVRSHPEPIQIGPLNSPAETLSLSVGWYTERIDEEGRVQRHLVQPGDEIHEPLVPRFRVQMGEKLNLNYPVDRASLSQIFKPAVEEIKSIFIGANGMQKEQIAKLWDQIALTDLEKDVLAALRIIAPGTEGVTIVGGPLSTIKDPTAIIKIKDIDEPLPFRSLGDSMQRVLNITLALLNTRDGMLLIDEAENGLHYSVLLDLWRLIFQLAHRLNIQIFVTTHRWDCIEAFQQAAYEDKQEEGMLIRLELKKDEVAATLFDERRLGIATREQIEVR